MSVTFYENSVFFTVTSTVTSNLTYFNGQRFIISCVHPINLLYYIILTHSEGPCNFSAVREEERPSQLFVISYSSPKGLNLDINVIFYPPTSEVPCPLKLSLCVRESIHFSPHFLFFLIAQYQRKMSLCFLSHTVEHFH